MSGWQNPEIVARLEAWEQTWYVSPVGTVYMGRVELEREQEHNKKMVELLKAILQNKITLPSQC